MSGRIDEQQNPNIHIPPPLILVVGFLAGFGLDRVLPVDLLPADAPNFVSFIQVGFAVLGMAICLWAFVTMARARTGIAPHQTVKQLVMHGPFRLSRNPIYVGLVAIYLSAVFKMNALWPLVMLPVSLWVLLKMVIEKEETFLEQKFGEAYIAYKNGVRRWL